MEKFLIYVQLLLIFATEPVLGVYKQSDNGGFTQSTNITSNGTAFTSVLDLPYDDKNPSMLTSLDIHRPATNNTLPIVFFIHGGGWGAGDKGGLAHINKRNFFIDNGFVFVSTNYRLAPDVAFPIYPQDVAKAFVKIVDTVADYNGNINEIFILGHSAGAHLGALISVDQSYLNTFGNYAEFIKGIVLLDGAGYDIPYIVDYSIQAGNQPLLDVYYTAFGQNNVLWENASPISHIDAIGVPPFQLFYVNTHILSSLTSARLYQQFIDNNHNAQRIAVFNSSHALINRNFGANGDEVAPQALAFINSIRDVIFVNGFE
ncbi:MAG: alpha/beta hydrolase [Xanthomonadales bacterium]|nr:alpha/beta hydrolase [Xanthomonadales bacterium]